LWCSVCRDFDDRWASGGFVDDGLIVGKSGGQRVQAGLVIARGDLGALWVSPSASSENVIGE
jgi:hypothetical protein